MTGKKRPAQGKDAAGPGRKKPHAAREPVSKQQHAGG
eukprot:CAMPEP_0202383646 /NCGR_PEP_ID=MMETSP1127-20130417/50439_1 /ASSEMBLY_ACC=CAM_ASM_000462 /TAXON_ID=3047 /ORGANISM="Dunaliella tertiolecta, Strain CCMP1320" /LENGTH=36 /DNA_ID= /DNA_START= /DNA_END= /DNA_ORIENTATION=